MHKNIFLTNSSISDKQLHNSIDLTSASIAGSFIFLFRKALFTQITVLTWHEDHASGFILTLMTFKLFDSYSINTLTHNWWRQLLSLLIFIFNFFIPRYVRPQMSKESSFFN